MDFCVLGPVGIADQDGLISVGGSKPRLLLAVFLAHRNRVVSSDALIDALWGERPPSTARTTLSSYISRLRRQIQSAQNGAVHLLAHPPGYVLETPDELVDAGRFERYLEQGRGLVESDPAAAFGLLDRALGIWRGDAFAEFAHEELIYADAVRLEELRLGCREDRLAAMLKLGLNEETVSEAEAFVAAHPLRERAWSQLMLGLTGSGRPAEALRAAERLRGHLAEIGLEPSSAVRELETAILTEQPEVSWNRVSTASRRRPPTTPNNLPLELTSFIGRSGELDDLMAVVARHRLVTLTGVGGVGKSRLALQVAQRLLPETPDGVFLVELAAIQDASLIVPTIARTLNLPELPGHPVSDTLDDHLSTSRLVLVLDNCEHLASGIADLLRHLLRTGSEVRVLTTSRVRLGVEGEAVWPVPALGLPRDDDPDAGNSDAVRLFEDRARLVDNRFSLEMEVLPVVGRICRSVEGIPLAIELAAARLSVLSAAQVETRLDDLGQLLAATGDGADPRHHTMTATLDWSHQLLDIDSQTLLRRLAVFQGGFDLAAAEAVAGVDPLPRHRVLDALHRLIDASLVARSRRSARYRLLEPVRQFAVGKLDEAGESERTAAAHARHFSALADEARHELRGADQEEWAARLECERDNIAATLGWTLQHDPRSALGVGSSLGEYWVDRGHHTEARRWLRDLTVVSEGADSEGMGLNLLIASQLAAFEGDHEQAGMLWQRADQIGRNVQDPWLQARSTLQRASLAWDHGRTGDAVPLYEEAVAQFDRLGSPAVTYALADLGLMLGFMGAFEQAEIVGEALRRAADRFRQPDGHAFLFDHLAVLTMYQGRPEEAWTYLQRVIPARRRLGTRTHLVNSLRRMMWPAIELSRFAEARAAFDEGMEISREMGYRAGEAGLLIVAARLHLATGEIDRARRVLADGLHLLGGLRRADWTMFGLFESGRVALIAGDADLSARLHGASAGIRERAPLVLVACQQKELARDLPELDRRLGHTGRVTAWQEGFEMSTAVASSLATRFADDAPIPALPPEPPSSGHPGAAQLGLPVPTPVPDAVG